MKIYLDYVFFVNFLFDFILLLGISMLLKLKLSKTRLFLGSIFGGLSGFIIFLSISSTTFFILKLFFGLIMIVITFSFKNIKYTMNNFIYLIILSILLGGFLYLININIPISNDKSYILLLVIVSFIFIILYSRFIKNIKKETEYKYKVEFFINNKKYNLIGYLDTGNNLTYKNRPVIILNKNIKINLDNKKTYNVLINTLNKTSILKCIKLKEIKINNKTIKNIYLSLSNDKFHLKNTDIILNNNMEDL